MFVVVVVVVVPVLVVVPDELETDIDPVLSILVTTLPSAFRLLAVSWSITSILSTVAVLMNISSDLHLIWNKEPNACDPLLGTITKFATSGAVCC